MSQFLESICAVNGKILNLEYHQKRVDRTFKKYFGNSKPLNLKEILKDYKKCSQKAKIRILYSDTESTITTEEYFERIIKKVKIVIDNDIDYSFKAADRSQINYHLANNQNYDDIIIVKNNLVTDSSYANIVVFDGTDWITPKKPLLSGVKREILIQNKTIKVADINIENVKSYTHFMLINALLDFNTNRAISTDNIF